MTPTSRTALRGARRGVAAAVGLALVATLTVTGAGTASAQTIRHSDGEPSPAAASVAIDTSSRASVRKAYLDVYKPAITVPVNWNGSTASCVAGTPSAAALEAADTTWNFYRALAGSGSITLTSSLNDRAQGVTLITEANGTLNHYPSPSSRCYTQQAGADSAQASLARGSRTVGGHLAAFVDDFGSGNGAVLHRRQLLAPAVAHGGVGGTSNASSTLLGNTVSGDVDTLVAWPSAGYFPQPLLPTSNRWSVQSSGLSGWDLSGATVTISEPGGRAATSQVTHTDSTAVVFTPTLPGSTATEPTYTVTIGNIISPNGATTSYRYPLTLFDPDTDAPSTDGEVTWSTQPHVSGDLTVGTALTVDSGVFSPRAAHPAAEQISYSWFRQGDNTLLRKGNTYTPTNDDLGHKLVARVHIAVYGDGPEPDAVGATATVTEPVRAAGTGDTESPTNTSKPTITGTPTVGERLTAAPGSWTGNPSYSYLWFRAGNPIAGATSRSYTLTGSDGGKHLRVQVTATNSAGSSTLAYSDSVGPIAAAPQTPAPRTQPAMSGDGRVDGLLEIDPGTWNVNLSDPGTTVQYHWFRDGNELNHTSRTYRPRHGDLNRTISASVTVTRNGESTTSSAGSRKIARGVAARANGQPLHKGTLRVGQTLRGVSPDWTPGPSRNGVTLRYQWLRNGKVVPGATGATYKLTRADRGKKLTFRVKAVWKGHQTAKVTSNPRGRVR